MTFIFLIKTISVKGKEVGLFILVKSTKTTRFMARFQFPWLIQMLMLLIKEKDTVILLLIKIMLKEFQKEMIRKWAPNITNNKYWATNCQWETNIWTNFKIIIQNEENNKKKMLKNEKKKDISKNNNNNNNIIFITINTTTPITIIEDTESIESTESTLEEEIEVNNSNIEKDLKEEIILTIDINFFLIQWILILLIFF